MLVTLLLPIVTFDIILIQKLNKLLHIQVAHYVMLHACLLL